MNVINFKNYVYGKKALDLSKKIVKVDKNAIICPSSVDIANISSKTKLKVFAQHVDVVNNDKSTGFLSAKAIKSHGASGTLINHSEHRIPLKQIKETIKQCHKVKLKTIVCARNLEKVKEIKKFKPWAIAFEDPKLISTGKSITEHDSAQVRRFAKMLKGTKILPLCGAGVSSREDIVESKKLGCKGTLIASAVAKKGKVNILR